jgi:hypothetical protein
MALVLVVNFLCRSHLLIEKQKDLCMKLQRRDQLVAIQSTALSKAMFTFPT